MFTRVLLPVDLTEKNELAFAASHELLRESGSVILLHVIETIADAPFEDMQEFYQRLEDKARSAMSSMAKDLSSADITVEQHVVYGRRANEIVAFAQEKQVDLIVLSSISLDPEDPGATWASISHQVAILAQCPVLLLK